MTISEHDRNYFRRIASAKVETHGEAHQAHQELDINERMARSWQLYLSFRETVSPRTSDDPTPFYSRAKELGFYLSSNE